MNRITKNMLIITTFFLAAISLFACGTKVSENSGGSDGTVTGISVSGSTVSGSETTEKQLQILAKSSEVWTDLYHAGDDEVYNRKVVLKYGNYGKGLYYAVTDLDRDGWLEIIVSNTNGSMGLTTDSLYEVSEKEEKPVFCGMLDGGPEGGENPTEVYRDEKSENVYYVFENELNAGLEFVMSLSGIYMDKNKFRLKENEGYRYIVKADEQKGDRYRDDNEKEISKQQYEALQTKNWQGMKRGEAVFGWQLINNQKLKRMTEEELEEELEKSWKKFSVKF
ncbi:MAG: hypothetical protein J1F22_00470 [Lachnospiraceae bacterium]|nr:hypothetical protein [Lachnospiraceae bacterium]